jgi:hypothetical protein
MHEPTPDYDNEQFVGANVYQRGRAQILATIAVALGPLSGGLWTGYGPDIHTYTADQVRIVIVGDETDEYLSVDVYNCALWPDNVAFGRFVSQDLQCRVRCEPGDDDRIHNSGRAMYLQIENGGERWVDGVTGEAVTGEPARPG